MSGMGRHDTEAAFEFAELRRERDEARAEVERLKTDAIDALLNDEDAMRRMIEAGTRALHPNPATAWSASQLRIEADAVLRAALKAGKP